jgi:hypothetical protein
MCNNESTDKVDNIDNIKYLFIIGAVIMTIFTIMSGVSDLNIVTHNLQDNISNLYEILDKTIELHELEIGKFEQRLEDIMEMSEKLI